MKDGKLKFLIHSFPQYKVCLSEDCTEAVIINPHYNENIVIYYEEVDLLTPFCASFSFQHRHLSNEESVVEWVDGIVNGRILAIEFFNNGQRCFGGEIEAKDLEDLSYPKLKQVMGVDGLIKLFDRADSFKVRGWTGTNNFDAALLPEPNGSVFIVKSPVGTL